MVSSHSHPHHRPDPDERPGEPRNSPHDEPPEGPSEGPGGVPPGLSGGPSPEGSPPAEKPLLEALTSHDGQTFHAKGFVGVIPKNALLRRTRKSVGRLLVPGVFEGHPREMMQGRRVLRFAHLTDLHYTTRKQHRYPSSYLNILRAVEHLNTLDLDMVLLTGDLFHIPKDVEAEMPGLSKILSGLRHPFYVAVGNHDVKGAPLRRRKNFLADGLGDAGLSLGNPYYTFSPAPGVRFVVLDSTDTGGDEYNTWKGHLSGRQMKWLAQTLAEHRDEIVFLALHHPPLEPYPFMGRLKFSDESRAWLAEVLRPYPNVVMALSGHYHLGGQAQFGYAELMLGPALVEHPHHFRIFEVLDAGDGIGWVKYSWETIPMACDRNPACSRGPAAVRSMGLASLSFSRRGGFVVPFRTHDHPFEPLFEAGRSLDVPFEDGGTIVRASG